MVSSLADAVFPDERTRSLVLFVLYALLWAFCIWRLTCSSSPININGVIRWDFGYECFFNRFHIWPDVIPLSFSEHLYVSWSLAAGGGLYMRICDQGHCFHVQWYYDLQIVQLSDSTLTQTKHGYLGLYGSLSRRWTRVWQCNVYDNRVSSICHDSPWICTYYNQLLVEQCIFWLSWECQSLLECPHLKVVISG